MGSSGGSSSDTLIFPGDGTAERMFLYDEDFAKVILDMPCFKEARGDYIVSGGISDSVTIDTLANIIADKVCQTTGNKVKIEFEQTKTGNGQNKKPCSNQKLINLYAETNDKIPVEDGELEENIGNVVSWFWHNYDEYKRK